MNTPATPKRGSWKSLALIVLVVVGGAQLAQWWREERAAQALMRHAQAGDITLYTTASCPYCAKARAWLTKQNLPWRECNVEAEASCMQTYEAQGAPGVPLVHARGKWHLGFDPAWLAEVLAAPSPDQPSPKADSSPRP